MRVGQAGVFLRGATFGLVVVAGCGRSVKYGVAGPFPATGGTGASASTAGAGVAAEVGDSGAGDAARGGAFGEAGHTSNPVPAAGGEADELGDGNGGDLGMGNDDGRGGVRGVAGRAGAGGSGGAAAGQGGMNGAGSGGGTSAAGMSSAGMSSACTPAGGVPIAGGGGFACRQPVSAPTCNAFTDWGDFCWGGTFTFGGLASETTNVGSFHVKGLVSGYAGFGLYFNQCEDLSAYRSVTFTLSGTTTSLDAANTVRLSLQENADEPVDTVNMKGGCSGSAGAGCQSPYVDLTLSTRPQTVSFGDLANGMPGAALDPSQIVGLLWLIRPDASNASFEADITLDDLTFDGDAPAAACPIDGAAP